MFIFILKIIWSVLVFFIFAQYGLYPLEAAFGPEYAVASVKLYDRRLTFYLY